MINKRVRRYDLNKSLSFTLKILCQKSVAKMFTMHSLNKGSIIIIIIKGQ